MRKAAKIEIVPHLQSLFNKILESGNYPDDWCKAILCPLHKSCTTCNVGKNRGISLLSVVSKIFTKMLNERFTSWAKENNVDKEEQAGYRRNYSTIDQIFNLQSLVQKYMCKSKGRCYVLMVDFSKTFDTVPHALLWYKLMKLGVYGRVLNVLRNMYEGLKSCVITPEGLTDYLDCARGTRQGCMHPCSLCCT